jgi:chromosome partitioning protein
MVADVAVLPVAPSAMDVWALAESIALVTKAQHLRPALRAALLVNRLQPRTTVGRSARDALEATGLPTLRSALGYRMTFVEAPAAGLGPTTYAPKSPAAAEVQALVTELERRV